MKIYTVTVFNVKEPKQVNEIRHITSKCLVGFFTDINEAHWAIKTNACDIHETCYEYAVIEIMNEGLYSTECDRWFYKWSNVTERYEAIKTPEMFQHMCMFYA